MAHPVAKLAAHQLGQRFAPERTDIMADMKSCTPPARMVPKILLSAKL